MPTVQHPLTVNTIVKSAKPPCACDGPNAPWTETTGIIRKVINNHSGTWYFLSSGSTVRADWIKEVVK